MQGRILIINHEFPPLEGGGANASFFISRELVRMGWRVDVVTSDLGQLSPEEQLDGVALHRVPGRRRPLGPAALADLAIFALRGRSAALRLAGLHRPDVVLAFFGLPGGLVATALRARLRVPVILSLRGTDVPGNNPETYAIVHRILAPITRRVWARADRVTAVSTELGEVARRFLPGLNIEIVPNGVDADRFRPRDTGRAGGTVKILSVGQTILRKGHATLIAVLAEMAEGAKPDAELMVVGRQGPDHAELQEQARGLGVSDRVEFRGAVPKNEMPEIYQEADVLAHLSICEGMSNVVLEAMASGLPIVATRVGGMSSLVEPGRNGTLVAVGDVRAAAEGLRALVTDPALREKFGRQSRIRAERLPWEACARRYADLAAGVATALGT